MVCIAASASSGRCGRIGAESGYPLFLCCQVGSCSPVAPCLVPSPLLVWLCCLVASPTPSPPLRAYSPQPQSGIGSALAFCQKRKPPLLGLGLCAHRGLFCFPAPYYFCWQSGIIRSGSASDPVPVLVRILCGFLRACGAVPVHQEAHFLAEMHPLTNRSENYSAASQRVKLSDLTTRLYYKRPACHFRFTLLVPPRWSRLSFSRRIVS